MTDHRLLYDRECAFCSYMVAYARAVTGDRVEYVGYQDALDEYPDISEAQFRASIYLFSNGDVASGAGAAFRTLAIGGRDAWLTGYERIPGFAAVAEFLYRFVSRHRAVFARLANWLFGPALRPAVHDQVARILTTGIGLCALIAFVSFWWQAEALIGDQGVLPYRYFLDAVYDQYSESAYWWVPTFAWLGGSDLMLHGLCALGSAASVMLLIGRLRASAALIAYLCYLSLVSIGQTFTAFQWDTLLLECLIVAVIAARVPGWGIWTARLLLLRFMLLSGAVKLLSGDPTWADGSALEFHFETQPLPTSLAWYADQLPVLVLQAGVWMTFFIELVLPFFILLPQRPRLVAGAGFILLELLIGLTGSYNFFNLLTMVLCIALLNDRNAQRSVEQHKRIPSRTLAGVLMLSGLLVTGCSLLREPSPGPLASLQPFHMVNTYGLFAVMTTQRRELVVEGSLDGEEWQRYEFPFKPGRTDQAPRLATPYQPRLDWQMWFAALGEPRHAPWIYDFVQTLLEARTPVLGLVQSPFSDQKPEFIRILSYRYQFTSPQERKASGNWWRAEDPQVWLEPVRLRRPVIRHEPLTLD